MNEKLKGIGIGMLKKYTMLIILIALIGFFSIVAPSFLSVRNFWNLILQNTYVIVAAVGMSFVMMAGALDLSVGYQVSTIGVVTATLMTTAGLHPAIAIACGILSGIAMGLLNGGLAVKLRVDPIIITVATTTVFQGFSFLVSQGNSFSGFPDAFRLLTKSNALGVPLDVIIAIAAIGVGSFVFNLTYYGRHVKAVGSNREATRLAGINVDWVTVSSFMISGLFISVASFVLISKQGTTNSTIGPGTEFTVITAAILGGISFTTGEGKMWGLVTGVFLLATIENGMQIAGWNQYIQYVVKGTVLLVALGFDQYQRSRTMHVRRAKAEPAKAARPAN
jgi:ribose/xylose/arabinose/galactoside ABC-type transport system permease subunit